MITAILRYLTMRSFSSSRLAVTEAAAVHRLEIHAGDLTQ
jgi:hypothetical protein